MNKDETSIREIRRHSRQLVRELDVLKGVYLDSGYTFTQCHVLFELSQQKTLNLTELAECLLIEKSNASRAIKKMVEIGLIKSAKSHADQRERVFQITAKGDKVLRATLRMADKQVCDALDNLDADQISTVVEGMQLYSSALRKSRLQSEFEIRPIQPKDNNQLARVIRDVMTEFQAVGEGYSIGDAEVDDMFSNYRDPHSCYFVIIKRESVVGGGGIGRLTGAAKSICELRKMFFVPSARGIGLGRRLLKQLLDEARSRKYKKCYLETLDRMWGANELYRKFGFEALDGPMGKTGHVSCDRWYLLNL